ncbi:flagellin [Piscinibacter koreensis]|nr:flagellin [Schlegelella koreensis]
MPISINRHPAAAPALALGRAQAAGARATEQLASGRRINRAADDAAGLAVASSITARVRGLAVGSRNTLDAISLTQTAEGALGSVAGNLQRLRELAVQAANATNSRADRAALHAEAAQLIDEIDRIGSATRFNGLALLDGSFAAADFQVGADAGQTLQVGALANVRAAALGNPLALSSTLAGSTLTAASTITGPGQLVVNGVDVWRGVPVAADARLLADAINAAGIGGLRATAAATVAVGTYSAGASGEFNLNGQGAQRFEHGGLAAAAAIADTVNLVNNGPINLLTDGGFEDGTLPAAPMNYLYEPTDQRPWSFSDTGVTGNHSAFTSGNAPVPQGAMAAFVQMGGVLSQTFSVTHAGSYDLAFQMVQRLNHGFAQTVDVVIDGQPRLQVTAQPTWTAISLAGIQLGAGTHTIAFVGGNIVSDGTAFLDDIRLAASGVQPPRSVVASDNGSDVTLTAADGSNIRLNMASGSAGMAGLGGVAHGVGSDGITYSHVDLAYEGNRPLTITGSKAAALGLGATPVVVRRNDVVAGIDLTSAAGATRAIDTLDGALATIAAERASLGATQNRLHAAVSATQGAMLDAQAALGRIVDADVGAATCERTRAGIVQQAALAMVAQANAHASDVLRLLRG